MTISGFVAPRFEPLAEVLEQNQRPSGIEGERSYDGGDLGASLCVIHRGEVVVDAWIGSATLNGRPWERDTLVNFYSVGKAVAAVLALDAVHRGELKLDAPVALVWPEMAALHPGTTLRHCLTHGAALPAVAETLPNEAIVQWSTMCDALAATPPWWPPGEAHGYHVNTYGFVVGEPVRRVADTSFRDALAERLCGPRELDVHIGLDPTDLDRCADIDIPSAGQALGTPDWPASTPAEQLMKNSYFNPPTMSGMGIVNSPAWRQASVPSTNGHGTARGVAGFFAALLPNAPSPLLSPELLAEATTSQVDDIDRVIGRRTRFGLGFQLHQDDRPIGTSPAAYGHFGFGGSLAFADPVNDVAFAYLMNRPGDRWQNPRTVRLRTALSQILAP